VKRTKRIFTPEQKANIVNQIDTDRKSGMTLNEAIQKQDIYTSLYSKWKHQLAVGIHSSLRNNKAPVDTEKKQLKNEVQKLRAIVLSQSQAIADLKKEMNLDW
jgi:transposase-like protein